MNNELPPVEYMRPDTLQAAYLALQDNPETARILAGGTDLLGILKDNIEGIQNPDTYTLIDITHIPELNTIELRGEDLYIGSAVPLSQLIGNELIQAHIPVLSVAAHSVGTTQLRNMGTLGGNLCQQPRCMYFRSKAYPCFKKGGNKCFAPSGEHRDYHAIFNLGKCCMAHPSDTAVALTALQAKCIIGNFQKERTVPIRAFFNGPNSHRDTVLSGDEILKAVVIPRATTACRQIFIKQAPRKSTDFALASVACVLRTDERCSHSSLVLGGVASSPYDVSKRLEHLDGGKITRALREEITEAAVREAHPLPENSFKIDLVKALVRKAVDSVA
ncbi:MAG: FAD binding domain-containing protein [Spirochaetota bacterium]